MDKKRLFIRIGILAALIALATIAAVYAVNRGEDYAVYKVTEGDISGVVKESGKIHGAGDKVYYAAVNAPVIVPDIKEGDSVKRGDIILKYDTEELERSLKEAEIRTEQAELDYSGKIGKSDEYASKYNKAVADDNSYAALYYIYREQGNEISEEQFARNYEIQCRIDSVNKEIAEKQREIAEKEHKKNKAAGYGTKAEDDYTENNIKDIKKAQKDIDALTGELYELNKELAIVSAGNMTPDENERLNDTNNVLEDITRNWSEAKSDRAAYEGNILNEDEKEALKKDSELSLKAEERASEYLSKAEKGVKSEFAGVITSLNIHDGAYVNEGTPLFTIENSEELVCRVNVSRYDILDIKKGQRAVVDIAGRRYEGEVTKTGNIATVDSSDKSRVEVEISLKDADEAAIIGLEGDATIYTDESKGALIIPVEAFYSDDGGDYCYAVRDKRIEKVYVEAGIENGSEVQVLKGLNKGDTVIMDAVTDESIGKRVKHVHD